MNELENAWRADELVAVSPPGKRVVLLIISTEPAARVIEPFTIRA
jgi:hypothetical protein